MRRTVRVFVSTPAVVAVDAWDELATAVNAVDMGCADSEAMVEVSVIGATPGWCVHDAVWIVSKAIGQIPALRSNAYVSEQEMR